MVEKDSGLITELKNNSVQFFKASWLELLVWVIRVLIATLVEGLKEVKSQGVPNLMVDERIYWQSFLGCLRKREGYGDIYPLIWTRGLIRWWKASHQLPFLGSFSWDSPYLASIIVVDVVLFLGTTFWVFILCLPPFISSLLILFYTYIYEGSLFLLCSCVFSVYNSIWVSCRIGYIFQTLNWEIIVWWWQGTSFWCRSICRLITIIWWLIMLLQL